MQVFGGEVTTSGNKFHFYEGGVNGSENVKLGC